MTVSSFDLVSSPAGALADIGLYAPSGWGNRWRAARNGGSAVLAGVGDSIMAGYFASVLKDTSWMGLLRQQLQVAWGDGGSGFQGVIDTAFLSPTVTSWAAQWMTLTGGWSVFGGGVGPGAKTIYPTDASTAHSLTASFRGTSLDIFHLTHPVYGVATVTIDGVAKANLVCTDAVATTKKTSYTGLAAGAHTVVIGTSGASQICPIAGVTGRNAGGVRVDNFACQGAASSLYSATGVPGSHPGAWSGGPSNPADLVVYGLGVNDAAGDIDADTYTDNLRAWAKEGIEARTDGGPDLIFVLPHVGTFEAAGSKYHKYCARMRGLAEAYGAALVNIWARGRNSWGYWNTLSAWGVNDASGGAGSDAVHPSNAGHALIAEAVGKLVLV